MQELGPRFTLKLRSLQKGTFDSKFGEYIWIHKVRPLKGTIISMTVPCLFVCLFLQRKLMDTSRRRFHL